MISLLKESLEYKINSARCDGIPDIMGRADYDHLTSLMWMCAIEHIKLFMYLFSRY